MNVFAICSAINAVTSRSQYSPEQRFNQTIETIQSVKNKCPDAFILICENTPISLEMKNILIDNVDGFIDLYRGDILEKNVAPVLFDHQNKSACEVYQMLNVLQYIQNIEYIKCFKLSGRYRLLETFQLDKFETNKMTFRQFKEGGNVWYSTVLYSFYKSHETLLSNQFKTILPLLLNSSINIESSILAGIDENNVNVVDELGVGGFVAPMYNKLNDFHKH